MRTACIIVCVVIMAGLCGTSSAGTCRRGGASAAAPAATTSAGGGSCGGAAVSCGGGPTILGTPGRSGTFSTRGGTVEHKWKGGTYKTRSRNR